ncbi:MAG TPA: PLP-dependent aspartate aminotransferase family protein [Gemmatimonadales bacterium]|nr:PLP-dependent aspartate aminotransferase family protein [Gemmatimonadales bacterium]
MSGRRGLSTTAVHGVIHRRAEWSPVAPAIVQSSTYINPVGSDEPVLYAGDGNTPTQLAVAQKYAALEGAEAAVMVASGMAATALAHLAVLRPGDHLISSRWIYGGTQRLFDEELARFGIGITYVSPDEPRLWRKSVRKETRAIFVETPTNPLIRVVDLQPILKIAKEFGLALLVDGTFASPMNFRPLEHGADVVITSATKYLNGHSDVIAGAVAGSASFVDEVSRLMRLWGQAIDPFAAWLLDRGLRTLSVRIERHNANGLAVAQWAAKQKWIDKVHYPGLRAHPDHTVAARVLGGFGGMIGLQLSGGPPAAERFLSRLRVVIHAPSLAGVESLISEPRLTSHVHLSPEQRATLGFPDGFVRLSCGIEDADDIIADLEQAGR